MWSCPINFKDDVVVDEKGLVPSTIANELTRVTSGTFEGNWHYYLPVKEIDGVDVETQFVGNENGLSLYIKSIAYLYGRKRLITCDTAIIKHPILFKKTYIKKEKGEDYSLRDFINVLEKIDCDINIMKFNKLDGVLYTPDVLHPKDQGCVFNHFDEKNNEIMTCIDAVSEECCVCLDSTKTTTLCGHKLCVMCWGKIKKNGRNVPCPICRKNLTNREEIDHLYPNGMATGPDADVSEIDWRDPYDDSEDLDSDQDEDDVEDGGTVYLDLRNSYYGFGYEDPHDDIQEFPSISENNIYDFY
jgi:hypothetical protein